MGEDKSIEMRVAALEELFIRFTQTGAAENILGYGFKQVSGGLQTVSERLESIAAQLAPLRALGPEKPDLTPEQKILLQNLAAALVRPEPAVKPTAHAAAVQIRSAP